MSSWLLLPFEAKRRISKISINSNQNLEPTYQNYHNQPWRPSKPKLPRNNKPNTTTYEGRINQQKVMTSILTAISHLQPHAKICKSTALRASSILTTRFSSAVTHDTYVKPESVSQWEKLAGKELSKSKKSVDSLRTERITPVS